MASKKTTPSLPERLRKLADDIEAVDKPKRPPTPEELNAQVAETLKGTSLKQRILERRERQADSEGDGSDDGSAHAHRPPRKRRPSR